MLSFAYLAMGAAQCAAAGLFASVAWHLAGRRYPRDVRVAGLAFMVAWFAFALQALNDGARILLSVTGDPDLGWYFGLARAKIWVSAAAIWAFGVYVAFLWTGRARPWSWILLAFALSHALLFATATELRGPLGVDVGGWVPRMTFEHDTVASPAIRAVALPFYFLPSIVLAGLFLALFRRAGDRTRRFRLSATAAAIIVFQAVGILQSNPNTDGGSPVFPILAALTLGAGVLAFVAYWPPAWMRHRLGLEARGVEALSRPALPTPAGTPGQAGAEAQGKNPIHVRL